MNENWWERPLSTVKKEKVSEEEDILAETEWSRPPIQDVFVSSLNQHHRALFHLHWNYRIIPSSRADRGHHAIDKGETAAVKDVCSQLTDRARKAARGTEPTQAACAVDEIREQAFEVARTSEALLRNLSQKLRGLPHRTSLPSWASAVADAQLENLHPRTLESFLNLVRAIPVVEELPDATVNVIDNEIEVFWHVPTRLSWVIKEPTYRWPLVNVRVHSHVREGSPILSGRTMMLAHRIVADAVLHFETR